MNTSMWRRWRSAPPSANGVLTSIKPAPVVDPLGVHSPLPSQSPQTLTPNWTDPSLGLMWRRWDDFRLWNVAPTWEAFIEHLEGGNATLRGEITSLEHQLVELGAKRDFTP